MAAPVSRKPGWRFGVFEVDAHRSELRRSGVVLRLREQSFQILVALLESPGEIVTREELRRVLWPADTFVDFDHSLNTAMMKLRDALGDSTEAPIYIETIPKHGYRFIAPVSLTADTARQAGNVEPSALTATAEVPLAPASEPANSAVASTRRPRSGLWISATAILLALAIASLVFVSVRISQLFWSADRGAASSYRIDSVTTFHGQVTTPAITPDGRDVAYAWNGGGGDHLDIYVQRIGLPTPLRLTYVKTGFVGFPAWSPDQREIAYTRCDGLNDGVYIVPALGGQERKLTSTNCQYHGPTPVVWLPGSQMLMIDRCPASGRHGLALFSMDTGEKHCIVDIGAGEWNRRLRYSISPDQKTVAFLTTIESPTCELYTVPVAGGSARRVLEDNGACDGVMWTPDGKNIVFLSERTKFFSFWQVPADGGKITQSIYPAIGTFSQDGRRFVYAEDTNGEPAAVWRADLASPGGQVRDNRKLIATQFAEAYAQPSEDGTRIVWMEVRAGIADVWTSSSTGENPRQLTHMNSYSGTPRWSPDGHWIAFDSYTSNGPQIFVIDAEGRNLHAITQGPYMNVVPSWSRDGRFIYFSSIRSGRRELWKHSLETAKEVQLTSGGGFNAFESFDRQSVYFAKFDEAGIWKVPSNGGKETLVLAGRPPTLHWGNWALTMKGIYFLDPDAAPRARIEFYDFATHHISVVLSLEKNAVIGGPSLSASTDGKTIFYDQMDQQRVIKVMEFSR